MARGTNESSRGRLAQLQDMLADGGQALLGQAAQLAGGVQRRIAEVGRSVEDMAVIVEERLGDRLDVLLSRLAVSIRTDMEEIHDRVKRLERRAAETTSENVAQLLTPVHDMATEAQRTAGAAQARTDELLQRLDALEGRLAALAQAPQAAAPVDEELRRRIDALEERLAESGRDGAARSTEVTGLRDRLGRLEARIVESGREQVARAGEATALRDRLARLEARLSDLSREQVARAVEAAGLRERVFRLEQRAQAAEPSRAAVESTNGHGTPPV
jgi:chromosome segregation ATPase